MLASVFSVSTLASGDQSSVVCSGEFDMAVGDRFREAVDKALAANPSRIHMDCSGITFIDSLGMRALLHTDTRCRDRGIEMTLTMSAPMRRLFDTVGVTHLFAEAPDQTHALSRDPAPAH